MQFYGSAALLSETPLSCASSHLIHVPFIVACIKFNEYSFSREKFLKSEIIFPFLEKTPTNQESCFLHTIFYVIVFEAWQDAFF